MYTQVYGLGFQTTQVVCDNFVREWRDLLFNVDSECQIFEKLFHWRFYSQSFCQKYFVLMPDLGYEHRLYV